MSRYAYVTEGVPAKAAAAATPLPTLEPRASSWGLVHVAGSPSTTRIDSPRPQSTIGNIGVWNETAKPSHWSPDYILPSLYIAAPTPQTHPNNWRTNELPIPAIAATGITAPASTVLISKTAVPAIAQRSRRIGGRKVTAWPKVTQTWPTYSGGRG